MASIIRSWLRRQQRIQRIRAAPATHVEEDDASHRHDCHCAESLCRTDPLVATLAFDVLQQKRALLFYRQLFLCLSRACLAKYSD